jgi:hypothetical protein
LEQCFSLIFLTKKENFGVDYFFLPEEEMPHVVVEWEVVCSPDAPVMERLEY